MVILLVLVPEAVNNLPSFQRVSNKKSLIWARRVGEKYDEAKIVVRVRSLQLTAAEAHYHLDEYFTKADEADINSGNDDQRGTDGYPEEFRL